MKKTWSGRGGGETWVVSLKKRILLDVRAGVRQSAEGDIARKSGSPAMGQQSEGTGQQTWKVEAL